VQHHKATLEMTDYCQLHAAAVSRAVAHVRCMLHLLGQFTVTGSSTDAA
jgi:hypothetical protein